MTVKYYEEGKEYLHPHIHQFINYYRCGNIIDLPLFTTVITWIETEQDRELRTIWVINALFQLINVIAKKQRINTKEEMFTGQDIWQEPIADIYLKIRVTLFSIYFHEHFSETPMYYCLQEIEKGLFKYALK